MDAALCPHCLPTFNLPWTHRTEDIEHRGPVDCDQPPIDRANLSEISMRPGTSSSLHNYQISQRPQKTWAQILNTILYIIVFDLGCLMINGFQITLLLPLRLLPLTRLREVYDEGIRYSKGAFGVLLGVSRHCERHRHRFDEHFECVVGSPNVPMVRPDQVGRDL